MTFAKFHFGSNIISVVAQRFKFNSHLLHDGFLVEARIKVTSHFVLILAYPGLKLLALFLFYCVCVCLSRVLQFDAK